MLFCLPSMSWKRQGERKCRPLKNQLFLILDHDIINIGSFFYHNRTNNKDKFLVSGLNIFRSIIWEMEALRKEL